MSTAFGTKAQAQQKPQAQQQAVSPFSLQAPDQQQQQQPGDESLKAERMNLTCKMIESIVLRFGQRYCNNSEVQLLQVDDIFDLAARFLDCQDTFQQAGKPMHVSVGFHYTRPDVLQSIRQGGLCSNQKQRHGNAFGKGIYVGTNPHAFSCYGSCGIGLLVLQGTVKQMDGYFSHNHGADDSVDSFLGNKLMKHQYHGTVFSSSNYFDEIILKRPEQVLPLVSFPTTATNNGELMHDVQCFLQCAADHFLNQGRETSVPRVYPNLDDVHYEHVLRSRFQRRQAANNPNNNTLSFPALYQKHPNQVTCEDPAKRMTSQKPYSPVATPPSEDCPICMAPLDQDGPTVSLNKCQHLFHAACLDACLQRSTQCPVCRTVVGDGPQGASPQGTMKIELQPFMRCHGFPDCGTFVLTYNIPAGVQSPCHPSPGFPHAKSNRKAYVPDANGAAGNGTSEGKGRDLLKRLRYAFMHGLTFTVGTSLTTGRDNQVVWASIHHKSSLNGGLQAHGFPDPSFFDNCNEELTAAGVPKAQDLEDWSFSG